MNPQSRENHDYTLIVSDFSGNNFFNTLGNLLNYPQAVLLFIDFATGDLLYLAVIAESIREGDAVAAFEGTERLVRLTVQSVQKMEFACLHSP